MKIKILGLNHSFLEVFGLVSVSPIHTGLIYVKIPTTNFSCLTPLKGRIRNALPFTLFYALTRREIITVRGQSYVSRLPKY
jgi:hypothetical protein